MVRADRVSGCKSSKRIQTGEPDRIAFIPLSARTCGRASRLYSSPNPVWRTRNPHGEKPECSVWLSCQIPDGALTSRGEAREVRGGTQSSDTAKRRVSFRLAYSKTLRFHPSENRGAVRPRRCDRCSGKRSCISSALLRFPGLRPSKQVQAAPSEVLPGPILLSPKLDEPRVSRGCSWTLTQGDT